MINLLPPQEKKELEDYQNLKIIIIWGLNLSIFLVSLWFFLLMGYLKIEEQLIFAKAFVEMLQKEKSRPENVALLKDLTKFNRQLSQIANFYRAKIEFSKILELILPLLKEDLKLESLTFEKNTKIVSLTGFIPTRTQLLNLKKALEQVPEFKELNFPPQNWLKAENINFFFSFKFQPQ